MLARIRSAPGLFAALDQSGGSTAGALEAYGISRESWADDAEMFALIHAMRVRILTSPGFNNRRVLAVILFKRTVEGTVCGQPVPDFLHRRSVASFLKIDNGLEDETGGVQLMKPIANLGETLDRARSLGIFGTKMRSVVKCADSAGIDIVVEQQFKIAEQISAAGLLPILEPEVSIGSPNRAATESILAAAMIRKLDALSGNRQVILKLTTPYFPDTYAALASHYRVARVLALSGGLSQKDACDRLARNHSMIASFSRALLENLDHRMDDDVFNNTLTSSIDQIYAASTIKRSS